MSALPNDEKQFFQTVGLFTRTGDRELGLDRRETGWFYPSAAKKDDLPPPQKPTETLEIRTRTTTTWHACRI